MSITHSKVSAVSDGGDSSLVQPSDWNDDHVIADGYALIRVASVILDNDDIIHIGETPIEVVPAPGVGKAILLLASHYHVDATAGVYSFTGSLYIAIRDEENNPVSNFVNLEGALSGGLDITYVAFPWVTLGTSDYDGLYLNSITPIENTSLSIAGLADPLTGGNAANTLKVTVFYMVVDL